MCFQGGSLRTKKRAASIDKLARTRLSKHFILRDFLFSAEAAALSQSNLPDEPLDAVRAGRALCEKVLEPIQAHFGPFAITFGFQSRTVMEAHWPEGKRVEMRNASSPHQWDRCTFGAEVYARVDLLPFCVEDGMVSKQEFGHWVMHHLDIDLLMQWTKSNVFCVTISPRPRRVWLEWGRPRMGEPSRKTFMGGAYWRNAYPYLPAHERPKFAPSCTHGSLQWKE